MKGHIGSHTDTLKFSVIDFDFCSIKSTGMITEFDVLDFNNLMSDAHNPIELRKAKLKPRTPTVQRTP